MVTDGVMVSEMQFSQEKSMKTISFQLSSGEAGWALGRLGRSCYPESYPVLSGNQGKNWGRLAAGWLAGWVAGWSGGLAGLLRHISSLEALVFCQNT